MNTFLFRFLVILVGYALMGCSSAPKISCQSVNWYEFGRLDGINGLRSETFKKHRANCIGKISQSAQTEYNNGRNFGLQKYCGNGWEEGSQGRKYRPGVCREKEQTFLREYKPGFKLFRIQQRRIQISNRLKLQKLDQLQKHELRKETELLEDQMVEISRSHKRIEKASAN